MFIGNLFHTLMFVLFAGLAIGCGIAVVVQRNPLYSAISLVGVFMSFAGLYILLAAPFIAAVQVIVYAGAIMVLVVFVIMLLSAEEEAKRAVKRRVLIPVGVLFAGALFGMTAFIIYSVHNVPTRIADAADSQIGLTKSIAGGLFTDYLLPFEITSVLILMAIVGAMSLARRITIVEHVADNDEAAPGAAAIKFDRV